MHAFKNTLGLLKSRPSNAASQIQGSRLSAILTTGTHIRWKYKWAYCIVTHLETAVGFGRSCHKLHASLLSRDISMGFKSGELVGHCSVSIIYEQFTCKRCWAALCPEPHVFCSIFRSFWQQPYCSLQLLFAKTLPLKYVTVTSSSCQADF